ncbi:hypothetical protein VNO78_30824 [Psophocarpus tetragonolobus]|uniref:Uncharacterized protein n=1 Tax=Psophocarpus tetragonolobus TaxID=3891 RepID=A0AAN9RY24_PSOTE
MLNKSAISFASLVDTAIRISNASAPDFIPSPSPLHGFDSKVNLKMRIDFKAASNNFSLDNKIGNGTIDGEGCPKTQRNDVLTKVANGDGLIPLFMRSSWIYFLKLKEKFLQQDGQLSATENLPHSATFFTAQQLMNATNNFDENLIIDKKFTVQFSKDISQGRDSKNHQYAGYDSIEDRVLVERWLCFRGRVNLSIMSESGSDLGASPIPSFASLLDRAIRSSKVCAENLRASPCPIHAFSSAVDMRTNSGELTIKRSQTWPKISDETVDGGEVTNTMKRNQT